MPEWLNFCLTPDAVRDACHAAIAKAKGRLDALASPPTGEACQVRGVCEGLDAVLGDLEAETAAPTFLKYCSPDPAVRDATRRNHTARTLFGKIEEDLWPKEGMTARAQRTCSAGYC